MAREPLNDAAILEALEGLQGWERDGDKLVKQVKLGTYAQGLAYATAVGMIADGFDHHPDLTVGYKSVRIELTTHDAGHKITEMDVRVARAMDSITVRG